jgi:acyl-CoA dehydrogenase
MPNPTDARQSFAAWMDTVRANAFDADPHLQSLIRHHGHAEAAGELRAFGGIVSDRLDLLARETNRDENLPRLRKYDGIGRRVEEVDFHPSYHEIGRLAYGTGAMSRYGTPGQEVVTLALLYLLAQDGEAGHACPFACTAGMIKILQQAPESAVKGLWMQRLLDPSYDTHFHAAQFLTEVQGGSDVGSNALVARDNGDGTWSLSGEKWFCSVADAHLFLVTARPEGAADGTKGLMAFAVPRHVNGQVNGFSLRRLKYKLGTRSMASSEIDFQGARAWPVGDFRRVVEVVLNTSRLYNAVCSAGMLQRAFREAHAYASTRMAFGQPILAFPSLARIVAKLRTEAYAARGLTFALASLGDRLATGKAGQAEAAAYRMLVNLNKYWTSVSGTLGGKDAIEVLGGNGAIEEFSVLPRLLRDSIVCEAWEGGHNVLCAQALRDSARLGLHEPMFAWLEALSGSHPRLDEVKARWTRLLSMPEAQAAAHVRDVADELRPVAQALALRAELGSEGHDPLLPDVIDHLLTTTRRGWDPLDDAGLAARVQRLVA